MKIIVIPNMPVMSGRHYCLSRELSRQGHQVTYFMWQLPNDKSVTKLLRHAFTSLIPRTYKYELITVTKAIRLPFFWPIINGWIFKYQLRQLYKRIGADIVITESYTNETEVPKNLPFIYDLADDYAGPAEIYGSKLYKLAFRLLNVRGIMKRQCQNAVAVTSVSKALNDYASELNPNSILLPNGVDQKLVEKVLRRRIDKVNPHSIVYATGFGPWSRAIETLETVTKLRAEFPDITLTLVGSGSETEKIKQYIKDNQAGDYISYLGYVFDQKQLFTILKNHAIGLNISDKNAWRDASHPMKVMDYSALGMKVVSTNLTEVEALGYDNLFIFSDTDKGNTFIKTLRKALKTDKPTQYSDVSKKVLRDYSWKNLMGQLMILCKSSLDQRQNEDVANSVVHVSYSYPPILGGLEKVAQQLAQAQSASGMQVSVLTARRGLMTRQDYHDTIPVSRLWSFEIANTTIIPALLWQLLKIKKNTVVHLHIAQAFSPEIVWLAAKIKGFRYVAHVHLDVPPSGPAGFLLKIYKPLVLARVLRAAHAVAVFTNDQVKTFVERYHIDPKKIHAVPNGVGVEFFINKPHKLHKKPRLLFVGRLNYQKNLKQLLYALDGISDKFATTIVGDGELKDELINLASSLKLKNVSFVGSASGETLVEYYKKADIFVLPSEREGMPLVLLEAIASGIPIVATRVSGNKDLVRHSKNGLLAKYDDPKSLRSALIRATSSSSKYAKMSQEALRMSSNYTWTKLKDRFDAIYRKRQVSDSQETDGANGPSLALVSLLLSVLAIAAYLTDSIIGSVITISVFLYLPGYLFLRKLVGVLRNWWVFSGLSVTLSIFLIMLIGLGLSALRLFGIDKPVNVLSIFISMAMVVVLLCILNRGQTISYTSRAKLAIRKSSLALIIILSSLPIIAIAGAIRLNNGGSSIITMVLYAAIAMVVVFMVLGSKHKALYPYALFMIALSILLSTSLRGWFITGHDIRHEFSVFQATSSRGFWMARIASHDPYNSCLSITIFPAILSKITSLSEPYIYKAVFQVIFAFALIPAFYTFRRFLNHALSFLAAFVIIGFPMFVNDMSFLNRQEIGLLFFISLIYVTFSRFSNKSKLYLSIIFLLGIMFSHYSTNYVTVALLGFTYLIYRLLNLRSNIINPSYLPILSIPVIAFALVSTYIWGSVLTQTSPNIESTLQRAINAISTGADTKSSSTRFSIFGGSQKTSQEVLADYAGEEKGNIEYVPEDKLPLTSAGRWINNYLSVERMNTIIHSTVARIYQVLLLAGTCLMLVTFYRRKQESQNQNNVYILSLALASVLMLVMLTVLPYVSVSYDVGRLFMQSLVVTAIPIILALKFMFGFAKSFASAAMGMFLAILFLFVVGFLPQLTGAYNPKISLANSGTYYNFFYEHRSDKMGGGWLAANRDIAKTVYLDTGASTKLPFPVDAGLLLQDTNDGYVFESYRNATRHAYRVFPNGDLIEYSDARVIYQRNKLYSNQGSNVYSPSQL